MKRKEITKFLAMMMSVAMITGSGVPVTAADLTSEEVSVETQNEDEQYAETDTEEINMDTETDAADATGLFTDSEEAVPSAGDEAASILKISAALNGGTAVDAEMTDEISMGLFKVLNITFKASDVKDSNTVVLTPTAGSGDTVEIGRFIQGGIRMPYTKNGDSFSSSIGSTVEGQNTNCMVTHADGSIDYYQINYHVSAAVEKTALSGTARLDKGTETGTAKELTADGTDLSCTFESSEATKDDYNYLNLNLKAGADDKIEVGTGYNSSKDTLTGAVTAGADGTFQIKWAAGNGPAKYSTTYYCRVTYADGATSLYKINITRKGYAGMTASAGTSETSPANGIWTVDTNKGGFKSWQNLNMLAQYNMLGVTFYDAEGNRVNSSFTMEISPDYKGDNFYIDDEGYLCAKGAGAASDCLIVKSGDQSYPLYIKAAYASYQGKTLLTANATDGVTTIDDTAYPTADDFAKLFPESVKENAKTFYTLVTECQEAIANNVWDKEIAVNGDRKFWSETCESAKLNKIIEMAPEIWSNIYGLKDAKAAITAAADIENAPEDKKAEIQEALDKALAQLDADYKDNKFASAEDVAKEVKDAKRDIYAVNPLDIAKCTVSLDESEVVYDGTAKTPEVTVSNGEDVLTADDYTVEYSNNTNAGEATVTVTGKGICTGSQQLTFTITPAEQKVAFDASSVSKVEGDAAFTVKVSAIKDAKLTYKSDNSKVATVDKNGKIKPVGPGEAVITVKASAANYQDATATVTVKVVKRILKVTKTSVTKKEGDAAFALGVKTNVKATVTYKTSDKNVISVDKKGKVTIKGPGRAVITVTGKASKMDAQTAKITVTVKPSAKLSTKAVAQKGRKLQVSWKRNRKVNGYQIEVSTDKSFRKVVKKVTVNKNQTVKATIKGLTAGKKYYVRVRGLKKATGGTVYGNWSTAKPVKAVK